MTRKTLLKIVLLPLALVLGIELLLQLGALIVAATGRDMATDWSTQNTRVLALGDSNTFGLYLDEEEAYPAQLEQQWNERHPQQLIEVLNLAYPGTNSFRMAETVDELITSFQPDVVLLTIGVNDMFTASEFVKAGADYDSQSISWNPATLLRRHSRLYKLIYMSRQGTAISNNAATWEEIDEHEGAGTNSLVKNRDILKWSNDSEERMENIMEFKKANSAAKTASGAMTEIITLGDKEIVMISEKENTIDAEGEHGFQYIHNNIASITRGVRESGARLYVLTYAASQNYYARTNIEIRSFVEKRDFSNFIDISAAIKTDCPISTQCHNLFFKDLHPKKAGYAKVASIVARRLEEDNAIAR